MRTGMASIMPHRPSVQNRYKSKTPRFLRSRSTELGNYTIGSCNCVYAALALCKNTIVSNISLSTRISPFGCSIK